MGSHPATDAVDAARAALDRYDWQAAYDLVVDDAWADDASTGVLEVFAEAAWWTSRLDDCIAARERLYRRHEDAGDVLRAGSTAVLLYGNHAFRGQNAVAGAWLARGRRLLAGAPECSDHGVLWIAEAEAAHGGEDVARATDFAERALDLGRRLGDADLEAESLQCLARLCIAEGRPDEGLALFDEAMLGAVEGRLSPFVVGKVYCSLISACEELGDLRRAAEWTQVGSSWAAHHPVSAFPGLCRVHRAEVLQMQGEWARAEEEARRASVELDGVNRYNTALSFKEIGDIRRRLGDLEGASEAFRAATDLGLQPQPGLALLRLAEEKVAVAARMIQQALCEVGGNDLARAKLLPAAVQIGVAAEDLDAARVAADELARIARVYRSSIIEASMSMSRGRLLLAEDDLPNAVAALRTALGRWRDLGVPYEVASTQVLLGEAARRAGDDDEATACFTAASAAFERLGAALDVARLPGADGAGPVRASVAGLTDREVELLRLVAAGKTNRAIAEELCVSEKTVERHLSNVFRKLGVSSRAAASARAVHHGLADAKPSPRDAVAGGPRSAHPAEGNPSPRPREIG
ncbi:MAG: LuxR C-terminal-related transcriptional regulator [Acidimicrobiia bacterium]